MLSLVGLDPAAKRRYSWLGDPACDVAASAREEWREKGTGLVALDGQPMTVFVTEALRPTTYSMAWGACEGQVGNYAAACRAAVMYGVVDIEDGPSIRRVHGPGGLRLHDELLAWMERVAVSLDGVRISLIEHLGTLILNDSQPTESEKKA